MMELLNENQTLNKENNVFKGSPIEVYIQIMKDMEIEMSEEKLEKLLQRMNYYNLITKEHDNTNGENTIYHAICSENVKLLDKLLTCSVFSNLVTLNSALSVAYSLVKLNNISVSEDMDQHVLNKLIRLRFYSEDIAVIPTSMSNIEDRFFLVLDKIAILLQDSTCGVNETFLYNATFIAKNLYLLKQQLKVTYCIFPWEEIVFCLVCFISAHTKKHELNVFYWSVFTKESILNKLKVFRFALMNWIRFEKRIPDLSKLNTSKRPTRDEVISGILEVSPEFQELYNDYTEVRDVYSLEKMSRYIDAALMADSSTPRGQLTIKRALQVMGEELKNTLESPNLSTVLSNLLLLSAPLETRQVLTAIRNSLSHTHILNDAEGYQKLAFYANVHNDLKKLKIVISQTLLTKKLNKTKSVLSNIKNTQGFDELNKLMDDFKYVHVLENVETSETDHITREEKHIEELFNLISKNIDEPTEYEKQLLLEIKQLFNQTKSVVRDLKKYYSLSFRSLKTIFHPSLRLEGKTDKEKSAFITIFKRTATEILLRLPPELNPSQINNFKQLLTLLNKLYASVEPRIQTVVAEDITLLMCHIHILSVCEKDRIKWIDEFKECLGKHKIKKIQADVGYVNGKGREKKSKEILEEIKIPTEIIDKNILEKLSELKAILREEDIDKLLKPNNTKQFMIETLFLDILSHLDGIKCLVGNILFMDDATPLLTGKCLRNYLAHGNPLVDILFPDVFTVILTNAKILAENTFSYEQKIGQIVQYDGLKLRENYNRGLKAFNKQAELLKCLSDGNIKELKRCLKEGADINFRNIHFWTVQHFAAQGPSLESLQFLINSELCTVNVKDVKEHNLLHIASASGRHEHVEYLLQEKGLLANEEDRSRRTPLHLAAQFGHKLTVEILLKHGGEEKAKDWCGHAPLHYAVRNNHLSVVQVLAGANIDYRESSDGFSPLHIAADFGYTEIVDYLLEEGSDVNDKAYTGGTPLYFAALNGHLQVVRSLINKGANVNMKGLYSGNTPLNNAAELGHEDVVKLLLKHNASVDIGNKSLNQTPIQCSSFFGHKGIVELLIRYKANVNAVRYDGLTALMSAALNGYVDIFDLLLLNGAKVDLRTFDGSTALHLSARRGHDNVVRSLLQTDLDIDSKDFDGMTALHVAALNGHFEVVQTLLLGGANVNCVGGGGFFPLHISASKGNVVISEVLLKMGAFVDPVSEENTTPLNEAMRKPNNEATITLLLKSGANIESKCKLDLTPLQTACLFGHCGAVKILIENKAKFDDMNERGYFALHLAAEGNHIEIVELLLDKGANVNAQRLDKQTALCCAVRNNSKEMVNLLLARGADVNAAQGVCILKAAQAGHKSMVDALLKNKNIEVNVTNDKGQTPLHVAVIGNFWNIGKALIKKGADIESKDNDEKTPLLLAVFLGRKEFVEVLLANGVNVDAQSDKLITATIMSGESTILDRLLSITASKVDILSVLTPLKIAVAYGRILTVRVLFQHLNIDVNYKESTRNRSLLHVAAGSGDVVMLEYLIGKGADLQSEDFEGLMPLHHAAKKGHVNIIDVLLQHGMTIDATDRDGNSSLHHSPTVDITKYLIEKCANVNLNNRLLELPIHKAAKKGFKDMIETLLNNGSIFDSEDVSGKKPKDLTEDKNSIKLLESVEKLFKAVEENKIEEVNDLLKMDCIPVETKKTNGCTLLHIATKNGFHQVCNILLKNKANLNAVECEGNVALHFAAEHSHFEIVKLLLSHGAVYNVTADNGNTPCQVANQQDIKDLLHFVDESFRKVRNGDLDVFNDLRSINDKETVKAIMKCRNEKKKILVNEGILHGFPKMDELQSILQEGLSKTPNMMAKHLVLTENFAGARFFLNLELMERQDVLGDNNPSTINSQFKIANTLVKECQYSDALTMLEGIYKKQMEGSNVDNEASLRTKSKMAFVLHQQGYHDQALKDFQNVYKRQKEFLGINHRDTLDTSMRLAVTLRSLARYDEAMLESCSNYERCLDTFEPDDVITLEMQNIIGSIHYFQNQISEAIELFKLVFEGRKRKLTVNHSDTMRAQHNVASMLGAQQHYREALEIFLDLYTRQSRHLGSCHIDTVNTQRNMACTYYLLGQYREAKKFYKDGYELRNELLGINHPSNIKLNKLFKGLSIGYDYDEINACQMEIMHAALKGDILTVQSLINDGFDVNTTDGLGRKPLHFAASKGYKDIVALLLKHGADPTISDANGDTPLHAATYKSHLETIEILLANVFQNKSRKFKDFINAKTFESGTTTLHIAVENQALEIVRILLKYGACFDILDSNNTPFDDAKTEDIVILFEMIKQLFDSAKSGDGVVILEKLAKINIEDQQAIISAKNCQMLTASEIALENGHEILAKALDNYFRVG